MGYAPRQKSLLSDSLSYIQYDRRRVRSVSPAPSTKFQDQHLVIEFSSFRNSEWITTFPSFRSWHLI